MKLPLVGALLLALSLLAAPAQAQTCDDFDAIYGQFVTHPNVTSGELVLVAIPEAELPDFVAAIVEMGAVVPGDVTRAFVLVGPGGTVVGLEVGGCLLPPINILAAVPTKGSGRLPDGTIGA